MCFSYLDIENLESHVVQVLDNALDLILKEQHDNDRIGCEIENENLDSSILVPFCPRSELNGHKVVRMIEHVLQSHEELNLADVLDVRVVAVRIPTGA